MEKKNENVACTQKNQQKLWLQELFPKGIEPQSKWTLPIVAKDGLAKTQLLVNTYEKVENAYIVITKKEMNGKYMQWKIHLTHYNPTRKSQKGQNVKGFRNSGLCSQKELLLCCLLIFF